ncbi:MAG: hypothetical protein LR001_07620 [Clostridiales bacterium]|nr:hypothetical protein [Clostridiales bacterium]
MIRRRFRRTSSKKNSVIAVSLALMISFVVMGSAYAIWDDVLFVEETITTGNARVIAYDNARVSSYDFERVVIAEAYCVQLPIIGKVCYPEVSIQLLVGVTVQIEVENIGTVPMEITGGLAEVHGQQVVLETRVNPKWKSGQQIIGGLNPGEKAYIDILIGGSALRNPDFSSNPLKESFSEVIYFEISFEQWNTNDSGWTDSVNFNLNIDGFR